MLPVSCTWGAYWHQLIPLPPTRCTAGCLQVLVGNKSDMDESKRAVPFSRGQALADEFKMQFFETSAKNNTNVDEVFQVGRPAPGSRWAGVE